MDLKTLIGNINAGINAVKAFREGGNNILNPDVALNAFFSRRFSSVGSYFDSLDRYVCKDRNSFPSLAKRKTFWIPSGDHRIRGYLYNVKNPKALVIAVHGITSLADDYNAIYQDYLVRHGYSVLAIDLTNSGASDLRSMNGLEQSAYDVYAAEQFVHKDRKLSKLPLCLIGHSWGAYGVAASLHFDQTPLAVVAMSGFHNPLAVMHSLPRSKVGPIADIGLEDLRETMEKRSGKDAFLSAVDAINEAKDTRVLIIQGDQDQTVILDKASIYGQQKKIKNRNCQFLLMPGKHHGDIWLSYDASKERGEVLERKKAFQKQNGGNIRKIAPEILKEFKDPIDLEKTSEIDEGMFEKIDRFFEQSIPHVL